MTKYILHGGFARENNESNRAFFKEVAKGVPDGGTILLCYFASKDEDNSARFAENKKIIEQESGKKFNFIFAAEESFLKDLKKSDAVYFNGGNTNTLLEILREFGDLKPFLDGKTIAGSSAGAYMQARYGSAHAEENVREGLGFLPIRLITHFESVRYPPTKASVSELESIHSELELVKLRDFEWKVFQM